MTDSRNSGAMSATQQYMHFVDAALQQLCDELSDKADWRRQKALEYPDDSRNEHAAACMEKLVGLVVQERDCDAAHEFRKIYANAIVESDDEGTDVFQLVSEYVQRIGFDHSPSNAHDLFRALIDKIQDSPAVRQPTAPEQARGEHNPPIGVNDLLAITYLASAMINGEKPEGYLTVARNYGPSLGDLDITTLADAIAGIAMTARGDFKHVPRFNGGKAGVLKPEPSSSVELITDSLVLLKLSYLTMKGFEKVSRGDDKQVLEQVCRNLHRVVSYIVTVHSNLGGAS